MKSKSLLIVGLVAVALIFGLNLRHAFNDYGFLENNLAYQIVAQTNSSGSDSSNIPYLLIASTSGGGTSGTIWNPTEFPPVWPYGDGTNQGGGESEEDSTWFPHFSFEKTAEVCSITVTSGYSIGISWILHGAYNNNSTRTLPGHIYECKLGGWDYWFWCYKDCVRD
jgi:hypothetical protein